MQDGRYLKPGGGGGGGGGGDDDDPSDSEYGGSDRRGRGRREREINLEKLFDDKVALSAEYAYKGGNGGEQWRVRVRGYWISKCPLLLKIFGLIGQSALFQLMPFRPFLAFTIELAEFRAEFLSNFSTQGFAIRLQLPFSLPLT